MFLQLAANIMRLYRHLFLLLPPVESPLSSHLKNLAKDYWSSTFFMKLREEASMRTIHHGLEDSGWNFSPRLSSVHCTDDPFHHEHSPMDSASKHRDSGVQ